MFITLHYALLIIELKNFVKIVFQRGRKPTYRNVIIAIVKIFVVVSLQHLLDIVNILAL